jgi:hypothetical protein
MNIRELFPRLQVMDPAESIEKLGMNRSLR